MHQEHSKQHHRLRVSGPGDGAKNRQELEELLTRGEAGAHRPVEHTCAETDDPHGSPWRGPLLSIEAIFISTSRPRPLSEESKWPLIGEKPQPDGDNARCRRLWSPQRWPLKPEASVTSLQAGVAPQPLQPPHRAQHLLLHPRARGALSRSSTEGPLTTGRFWGAEAPSQSAQTAEPPGGGTGLPRQLSSAVCWGAVVAAAGLGKCTPVLGWYCRPGQRTCPSFTRQEPFQNEDITTPWPSGILPIWGPWSLGAQVPACPSSALESVLLPPGRLPVPPLQA